MNSQLNNIPNSEDGFISVFQMNDADKLPKEIVELVLNEYEEIKILEFDCSIIKEHDTYCGETCFDVVGVYRASTKKDAILLVMIYNANNELCSFTQRIEIPKGLKGGRRVFSESLYLPIDEYISKAEIRVMLSPSYDWK